MTSVGLFKLIVEAAKAGARCPVRREAEMRRLVAEGWVEVRVYGRNWRVAKIIRGEFAGLETKASPCGKKPWLISTSDGTFKQCRSTSEEREVLSQAPTVRAHRKRVEPSKPRPLTAEEIGL